MVAFAGQTFTSLNKYFLTDSVSLANTVDFCGEILLSFKVNSTDSSLFTWSNSDYIHFSPSQNSQDFGVSEVTVLASMKNYPAIISAPIKFTLTVLRSIPPKVPDQTYTIGSAPLQISVGSFLVIPLGIDVGVNRIDAYVLN